MQKEKAYLEVHVDAYVKKSEVKAKEVAKITNEVRAAEQRLEKLEGQ